MEQKQATPPSEPRYGRTGWRLDNPRVRTVFTGEEVVAAFNHFTNNLSKAAEHHRLDFRLGTREGYILACLLEEAARITQRDQPVAPPAPEG